MKYFIVIIFCFVTTLSFCQRVTSITTDEINSVLEKEGFEKSLDQFSRHIDLIRLDSSLALNIARACNSIEEFSRKFLSRIGSAIKDDTLNQVLINHVNKYRGIYKKYGKYPMIEPDILHSIVFQNNRSSIDPIKSEFQYWKIQTDSLKKNIKPGTEKNTNITYPYRFCHYNSFMLAWTLNQLGDSQFSTDYVKSLGDSILIYENIRPKNLDINKSRSDTLTLSRNYYSLNEIDYLNEPSIDTLYHYITDKLDNHCGIELVYKSAEGIIEFGCYYSELSGGYFVYKITLISPNKVIVRFLNGGIY